MADPERGGGNSVVSKRLRRCGGLIKRRLGAVGRRGVNERRWIAWIPAYAGMTDGGLRIPS